MRHDPYFMGALGVAAICGNPVAVVWLWCIWQKGM